MGDVIIFFATCTVILTGIFFMGAGVHRSEIFPKQKLEQCELNLPRTQHCEWFIEARPVEVERL